MKTNDSTSQKQIKMLQIMLSLLVCISVLQCYVILTQFIIPLLLTMPLPFGPLKLEHDYI